jgi:CubicO group peptidase (beta-lactamase class C family)
VSPDQSRFESDELDSCLSEHVVAKGVAYAATAGVAFRQDGHWVTALGSAGSVGNAPTTPETPFDLASVTKPVTALLCATLVERGRFDWDAPLTKYLPELAGSTAGGHSSVRHLSHRAGLVPHRELFAALREARPFCRNAALREAASARREGEEPDSAVYSDLGYILVGEALARATGRPLDELLFSELRGFVGDELGSSRQWRQRDPSFAKRVAPTEVVTWRGGLLRGEVHDDNAWALAGHRSAGHAGLFGTVSSVLRLGITMLDSLAGRGVLGPAIAHELTRPREGGSLRMGFDSKSGPNSMAGRVAGSSTFGHLGFTGTSLWCDPEAQVASVLLTNRVCPTQTNRRIRLARPLVHDALFQLAATRAR